MKIVVTGSLGHISKPLTVALVQQGHSVTVISSNPEKQKDIEALGAMAAIGTMEDVNFLAKIFSGADAVYMMTPPDFTELDHLGYGLRNAFNYVDAIKQSGVKRIVHLSSYGAHLDRNTGMILAKYFTEKMLNDLPGVAVTHMRPAYFYYNLYSFTEMIRHTGVIQSNYGGDDKIVMVSPSDIADAIAKEIVKPAAGSDVVYVASDERSGHEIASVLGAAIGKPDLKWEVISDEAAQAILQSNGLPVKVAANLVEMMASLRSGALSESYYRNKPTLGKVKLEDFAKEFASVYNQK
jgi:uncharacterized protein YbjT (DUF2867 family)